MHLLRTSRTFLYNVFNFANGGKRRKGDKNVTPDLTEEKEGEETGKVGFPFRHPPKKYLQRKVDGHTKKKGGD